ncbi:MAG: hypothetical protein KAS66_05205 [Candidatus Omnitrophica bacterium]|nr:hypothetical protein [Candidatus Omnitrophota bacterium]
MNILYIILVTTSIFSGDEVWIQRYDINSQPIRPMTLDVCMEKAGQLTRNSENDIFCWPYEAIK